MTQGNGPEFDEPLEGETPFLEDAASDFLAEHARRTGDRRLSDKARRRKRRQRRPSRVWPVFVTPVLHHYSRGLGALREIYTQIARWEREPGWLMFDPERGLGFGMRGEEDPGPPWKRTSPFWGLEDPRISSKLSYALNELKEIKLLYDRMPKTGEGMRGLSPIARWFTMPVRDALTGEITFEPTIWVTGAVDEVEWHMEMLGEGINGVVEYLEELPGREPPGLEDLRPDDPFPGD